MKSEHIMGGLLICITIFTAAEALDSCNVRSTPRNGLPDQIEINCKALNLTRFPEADALKLQAEIINLQYNRIEIIHSGTLDNYWTVQKLNLTGNAIKRVDSDAFAGAIGLEKLDLSGNIIRTLDLTKMSESLTRLSLSRNLLRRVPRNLTRLCNLKHLDLSHNYFISNIPEGSLPSNLTELDLRFTRIKYISRATFSGLKDLTALYLSDNMASSSLKFGERPFDELRSLQYLDLSRSFCRRLRPDSFSKLKRLKTLLMSGSWITSLPQLGGRNISDYDTAVNESRHIWFNDNLKVLDLSNNLRLKINSRFHLPPSLKEVNMSHCRVSSVEEPIFNQHSLVESIDLSFSGVSSLCEDAFANAENLTRVTLVGSPIKETPRFPESLLHLSLGRTNISTVSRKSMASLQKLLEAHFDNGVINDIEDNAFADLHSLSKLDLSGNKLRRLTKNTLIIGSCGALPVHKKQSRLLTLNVSRNTLTRVSRRAFACHRQLHTLDLSGNFFKVLKRKQFDGLENLQSLFLNYNYLSRINVRAFEGIKHLKILHLEDNLLDYIYEGTFASLPALTHLYLQNNKIKVLERIRAPTLEYIDLSYNNIWKMPNIMSSNLQTLKASFNDIENVPYAALMKANKLKVLELSNCALTHLYLPMFNAMTALDTLDLSNNFLTTFVNVSISSLKHLYLKANDLTSISNKFSALFPNLHTLDIRSNNISQLNILDFYGLTNLNSVYLSNNNLRCECELLYFVDWLENKVDTVSDVNFWTCEKPIEKYGMPVVEVVRNLTTCKHNLTIIEPALNVFHRAAILASSGTIVLLLSVCIAFAIVKKWSLKIKLKVKDNNNKYLRGSTCKRDSDLPSTNKMTTDVT